MKLLFVVCGEGLGHASRSLHLGHYLQQQGHEVHFAGYEKSYDFMNQHGCTHLHCTPREVCLEGEGGFFSLKKTLWHSKWIGLDMVRSALSIHRLIKKHRFDCIVCDTMYGGVLAARFNHVPVVFVTNQNHFNGHNGTTNPVWRVLNFLIRRYIRLADLILIPDYPAPDTVSEYNIVVPKGDEAKYVFCGPFYVFDPTRYVYESRNHLHQFRGGALQTPDVPDPPEDCRQKKGPVSSMSSIPVRNCQGLRTTSSPTGTSRTSTSTLPGHGSQSSTAASPPCTRRCSLKSRC